MLANPAMDISTNPNPLPFKMVWFNKLRLYLTACVAIGAKDFFHLEIPP